MKTLRSFTQPGPKVVIPTSSHRRSKHKSVPRGWAFGLQARWLSAREETSHELHVRRRQLRNLRVNQRQHIRRADLYDRVSS
jgi:hypothetical protein